CSLCIWDCRSSAHKPSNPSSLTTPCTFSHSPRSSDNKAAASQTMSNLDFPRECSHSLDRPSGISGRTPNGSASTACPCLLKAEPGSPGKGLWCVRASENVLDREPTSSCNQAKPSFHQLQDRSRSRTGPGSHRAPRLRKLSCL